MPNAPTYPGVYIEEVPSSVHTISGVQTSITAFVGPTRYGPVDEPGTVFSMADFERKYGGLSLDSPLSFAVRDFFTNGGSKAIIARVYKATAGGTGHATIDLGKLKLEAVDPGVWGNDIKVRVIYRENETYDLIVAVVRDEKVEYVTVHRGVSSNPEKPRRVDRVLEAESDTVRVAGGDLPAPKIRPKAAAAAAAAAAGGAAGAAPAAPPAGPARPEASVDPTDNSGIYAKANEGIGKSYVSGTGGTDSDALTPADVIGSAKDKTGLYLLDKTSLFNLLCIPPLSLDDDTTDMAVIDQAARYCEQRRAMLVVDPPADWKNWEKARDGMAGFSNKSANAAIFFPRIRQPNFLRNGRMETFVPCGAVAGVMARTDADRGVWKAPAGNNATLAGVPELDVRLTDMENGELNPMGLNCLRTLPEVGRVIWGTRTLKGGDSLASEWKYVPVRRLALFLEETLFRSTGWVVFEPNDEPLWSQIRLNLGAFMHGMFRQGAFQGSSPKDAYFVKCDADTTPQEDRDQGIVNIRVGFAPLKPAEFVIISFQQMAGQIHT